MTIGRSLFSLAVLASLSACNMVVSDKPMFDAPSGPQLRDGLWANLNTPDCAVGADQPVAQWPECAKPMLVRGGDYSGPPSGSSELSDAQRLDPANWESIPHVLVDGDPQVDQIRLVAKPDQGDGGDGQGAIAAPPAAGLRPDKDAYLFFAVRPVKRDADGRIVETQRWPVLCGPMPEKPGQGKDGMPVLVTNKPFKGLVVADGACTASSIAALMGAAKQSEALAKPTGFPIITSRWVRDGVN